MIYRSELVNLCLAIGTKGQDLKTFIPSLREVAAVLAGPLTIDPSELYWFDRQIREQRRVYILERTANGAAKTAAQRNAK